MPEMEHLNFRLILKRTILYLRREEQLLRVIEVTKIRHLKQKLSKRKDKISIKVKFNLFGKVTLKNNT